MIGDTPLVLIFTEDDDGTVTASIFDHDALRPECGPVPAPTAQAHYGTPGGEAFANAQGKGGDVLRLNRRQHAAMLVVDAAFRDAQWDRCRD